MENVPAGSRPEAWHYPGYDAATVQAHLGLLIGDAGLLTGEELESLEGSIWIPSGITWKGFDFLEASRDESIWAKAQESILKPTASFTFDLLLEWLKTKAKESLGLP